MSKLVGWLAAALVVTLIFGSTYVALQQLGRSSANDAPAAAAAEHVKHLGAPTGSGTQMELAPDSGVFLIVYGADGKPESGTVTIQGALPVIPAGVLGVARSTGCDVVTWQPAPNLRMAVVARPAGEKVVVAGQSLAPYEARDGRTMMFLAAGWLASMVALGAGFSASTLLHRRHRRHRSQSGRDS